MISSNTVRRCLAAAVVVAATAALAAPQAVAATAGSAPTPAADQPAHREPPGRLGSLTDLVIQRLLISDQVAAAKFGTDLPIDDPAREQQELDAVRRQAAALGLDPDASVRFFQDQITASKIVQEGDIAYWTAHPDQAPTSRPSLTVIRAELDQLTTELLQELESTQELRRHPAACTVQLALATVSGTVVDRLDALHRQALATATQSVCPPLD